MTKDWTKETRRAPRWAWQLIDETLQMDAQSGGFDAALRDQIGSAYAAMETVHTAPRASGVMQTRWVAPGQGAPVAEVLAAWGTIQEQTPPLRVGRQRVIPDHEIEYVQRLHVLDVPMDRTELVIENALGRADETDAGRVEETLRRVARRARLAAEKE